MWKTTSILAALMSVSAPGAVLGDPPLKAKTPATQPTPSPQPQKQWMQVNGVSEGASNPKPTTTPASAGKSDVSAISTTGKPKLQTQNNLEASSYTFGKIASPIADGGGARSTGADALGGGGSKPPSKPAPPKPKKKTN